MIREQVLRHELEIVWLEPPEDFEYVREGTWYLPTRQRKPHIKLDIGSRVVGYAVLHPAAPNCGLPSVFGRRIFFVRRTDIQKHPGGTRRPGCPVEGVDPLTVRPGVAGEQNERACGGPLPVHDSLHTS